MRGVRCSIEPSRTAMRSPTRAPNAPYSVLLCSVRLSAPCGGDRMHDRLRDLGRPHQTDELRDDPGPARLMTRANPRAIVAMEVLEEQEMVTPVRIALELLRGPIDGTSPLRVAQEDARQAVADLLG